MLEDKKEEMLSKSNYLWLRGWQPAETEGWCWPGTGILLDKFFFLKLWMPSGHILIYSQLKEIKGLNWAPEQASINC